MCNAIVTVPGTFRNNNSENREPTGDRSLNDPCPEVVFSAYHTSNLIDSDGEETHLNYHVPCHKKCVASDDEIVSRYLEHDTIMALWLSTSEIHWAELGPF